MTKDHARRNAKKAAAARSAEAKPAGERPSLPGERAEGEGMIASAPEERGPEMEGEGSYTAARHYDEGVERSVAKGDTERLANEAAKALDGPEGAELRKAEQAAKHGHA